MDKVKNMVHDLKDKHGKTNSNSNTNVNTDPNLAQGQGGGAPQAGQTGGQEDYADKGS